jgi:hypothetical protein
LKSPYSALLSAWASRFGSESTNEMSDIESEEPPPLEDDTEVFFHEICMKIFGIDQTTAIKGKLYCSYCISHESLPLEYLEVKIGGLDLDQ